MREIVLKNVNFLFYKLTPSAIKDYNRGRPYLKDMAKKAGVPVFENPEDAVKKAIDLTKSTS